MNFTYHRLTVFNLPTHGFPGIAVFASSSFGADFPSRFVATVGATGATLCS